MTKPVPQAAKPTTVAPAATVDLANRMIEYTPFGEDTPIKLSPQMVINFLTKPTKNGAVCPIPQAIRFLMLCQARKLNPFVGDAYLLGYDAQDGPEFTLITAHQAFLKRGEAHPEYDGMESGVILVRGGVIVEEQGDFYNGDDILVGGWAKVFRRDRSRPIYRRLKLATFNQNRSRWKIDPAGMIVKCAEADALRSSFPNNIGGMYMEEELGAASGAFSGGNVPVDELSKIRPPAPTPSVADKSIPTQVQAEPEKEEVDSAFTGDDAKGNLFGDERLENLKK